MKKLILILLITISLPLTANAKSWINNWSINGVPIKQFKVNPIKASLGMLSSCIAHTISHYAAASFLGEPMRQEGITENMNGSTARRWEYAMISRAGFIGQLTLGYILNHSRSIDKDFMVGYNAFSLIEITTYPFIHNNQYNRSDSTFCGDLGGINLDSNANAEIAIYTIVGTYNLLTPIE